MALEQGKTTVVSSGSLSDKKRRWPSARALEGYVFTSPAVLYLVFFSILPLIYALYLSFTADVPGQREARSFAGLTNFIIVLSTEKFRQAAKQTAIFAALSTGLHISLGLGVATLFKQEINRRYLAIARSLFLLPWAVSPVVVGVIFRLLYSSQFSFISIILREISPGLTWQPLSSTRTALLAVTMANVWHFTPYMALNILAGLQGIPKPLYEAAAVDGATPFQSFYYVTLPGISRLLLTIAFFDFAVSTLYFDLVWILTQGGPVWSSEVIATHVYRKAFQQYSFGYASAAGMLLFVLLMVMTAIVVHYMERE